MAIGERLRSLLELRGRNVNELAQELGVSASTIYSILRRNNQKANPALLRKLAEALDAPLDFFFESLSFPEDDPAPADTLLETRDSSVFPKATHPPSVPHLVPIRRKRIPLLGSVAAGEPIWAEAEFGEAIDSDVDCDFALRVAGDSMSPLIERGDVVFIRSQPDVLDGQIAVVLIDNEATLKRVYHLSQGVQLVSINPAYAPMHFDSSNSDTLRILGRAVAYRRSL